ncbi:MAG: glycosyltransferase family 4 protein [Ignavibacteriales bacterium]|nr:glycosyltransferase family 4 protein [Ignavibacteriales bacterium]MCB9258883.1 glycosyltransferase family 4 protein [Ignavibacteriales bacterium]
MNIGMILDNEFTGDNRVENEVVLLQNAGYKVFVLCLNYGKKDNLEDFNGAKIIRFGLQKKIKDKLRFLNNTVFDVYSIYWSFKIESFVKKYSIDVLHAHDLYMAKSVIIANKKLNLPTVLDLHENYPATLNSYSWSKTLLGKIFVSPKRWIQKEKEFLPKFSKIILLSETFKDVLSQKYPRLKSNFYVYQNYPNVEKLLNFEIDKNIINKKNSFVIFYFGAIAKRRGIFTMFEALKILLKNSDQFKMLIIGPVDNADKIKLDQYLTDPKLKENIIQYDWRDINFLPSYISVSDVCVSPLIKNDQHESGIANKVFQYMLFKKPLLVSNCKPQQKVVEEENCGLVFESENANDFADKILMLKNNPDLCIQMGENGNKAVLEKFNTEVAKKQLVKLYENL